MVVVAHSHAATSEGTGSVSRLHPDDGAVLWTTSLGTDSHSGLIRAAYRVALDSRGNVYALWMLRDAGSAAGYMYTTHPAGETVGGVAKLDSEGNLLDVLTLGALSASFPESTATEPFGRRMGRIVIDPAHDDRIYFSCLMDDDDNWLYRIDDTLTPQWGFGPSAVSTDEHYQAYGGGLGLALDNDGDLYVASLTGKTITTPSSGRVVLLHLAAADHAVQSAAYGGLGTGAAGVQFSVLVDSLNNQARSAGFFAFSSTSRMFTAWPRPLAGYTEDWNAQVSGFSYSTPGAWNYPAGGEHLRFAAGLFDGERYIWACNQPLEWDQTGTTLDIFPSLFATDRTGAQAWVASLTNGTPAAGQAFFALETLWDLAIDERHGGLYAVGAVGTTTTATGRAQAIRFGKLDGAGQWWSALFPSDSVGTLRGFGVAARSVNAA